MLEEYRALLGGFSIGDFFPSMEFIYSLTGMKSRLQDTFQRFDKLFDQLLTKHGNPKREKEEQKDLLDVLLNIQKNGYDEMPFTIDNIKAIILVSEHSLSPPLSIYIYIYIYIKAKTSCERA